LIDHSFPKEFRHARHFAVETVVITFPALKTFFASWQAYEPVPVTGPKHGVVSRLSYSIYVRWMNDLQPAGTKTVFPSREPLYLLNAWSAVLAANGSAAASPKESDLGLRSTYCSAHLAYSLHEPAERRG
jgi:hypothetical protein